VKALAQKLSSVLRILARDVNPDKQLSVAVANWERATALVARFLEAES